MRGLMKNTLKLPKTDFPMRANLAETEVDWLDKWKVAYRPPFIIHDGPPYANGHLHIGHALNKILKDLTARSHQMMGYDVDFRPGWDCHGLPIEWQVEKNSGKENMRENCRTFASKWVNTQMAEFKRLGISADFSNPYLTMDYDAEAGIATEFMKFVMNGRLYQGSKPVMWSPVEQTSLADAEVEYKDKKSYAIRVRFKTSINDAHVVIWTTTPWTIPANKAIAFNKKFEYGLYDDNTIRMTSLLDDTVTLVRVIPHDELEVATYTHPFSKLDGLWEGDFPLIHSDHVTNDVGTGFVHIAPSHGVDDYACFIKRNWQDKLTDMINPDSSFKSNIPFFAGERVINDNGKDGSANKLVMATLSDMDALVSQTKITHSYPHSWRSKSPIIYRNTPQWFISLNGVREDALKVIDDDVKWTPPSGKARMTAMVKDRPDWLISRQREWGVPLTCFVNGKGELLRNTDVNTRIVAAFKSEGASAWFAEGARERFLQNLSDDDWTMVTDILDVWFDSGSSHAYVLNGQKADVYLEGTDQHRGWFQSSLLESVATTGQAPYKNVVTHGFVLDKNGRKMSKSEGNVIHPEKLVKKFGADILRLWVAESDYTGDLRIGDEIMQLVAGRYRKIRNTFRFMLGNTSCEYTTVSSFNEIDEHMLHRLAALSKDVQNAYRNFNFSSASTMLFAFCNDLSNFYFNIQKDSLYCDVQSDSTRSALKIIMDELAKLYAPILPFTMAEVWSKTHDSDIHSNDFAGLDAFLNPSLDEKWSVIRRYRKIVTEAAEIAGVKSTLDATAIVKTNNDDAKILASINFADVCVMSSVTVDIGDSVSVSPAKGIQCKRCWKVTPIPVCIRCSMAIDDNIDSDAEYIDALATVDKYMDIDNKTDNECAEMNYLVTKIEKYEERFQVS